MIYEGMKFNPRGRGKNSYINNERKRAYIRKQLKWIYNWYEKLNFCFQKGAGI